MGGCGGVKKGDTHKIGDPGTRGGAEGQGGHCIEREKKTTGISKEKEEGGQEGKPTEPEAKIVGELARPKRQGDFLGKKKF